MDYASVHGAFRRVLSENRRPHMVPEGSEPGSTSGSEPGRSAIPASVAGYGVRGPSGPRAGASSGERPGNSCGCGFGPGSCIGGGISGRGSPGGSSRGGSVGVPGVAGGISGGSIGIVTPSLNDTQRQRSGDVPARDRRRLSAHEQGIAAG